MATKNPITKKGAPWTPDEDAVLALHYPKLTAAAVAETLGRTTTSVVCRASRLDIKANNAHRKYTPKEDAFLVAHYPTWSNDRLAKKLNATIHQLSQHARALGLKKTRATWLRIQRKNGREVAKRSVDTQFQKGLQVWNKGKKMRIDVYERAKPTMFKKGQVSRNKMAIGTEVLDPDGYKKRKVSDDRTIPNQHNWKLVHILLWETLKGPIPPKHVVTFKDGDKTNIVIDNLECIPRGVHAIRNKAKAAVKQDHRSTAHKAWRTRRLREALIANGVTDPVVVAKAKAA